MMSGKTAIRVAHVVVGALLFAGGLVLQFQSSGREEIREVVEPIRNTLLFAGGVTVIGPFISRSTVWLMVLSGLSFLVVAFLFTLTTCPWFSPHGDWSRYWIDPALVVFALFLGAAAREA